MTDRSETFVVEWTLPQVRLDAHLRERYPMVSRGAIQRLIEEGHIRVNGQKVKPTHTPKAGELVEVRWPAPKPMSVEPVAMDLDILHEDRDLLVVNKPAGLVVHPASGTEVETLVNAMAHHCRGQLSGIGGVERPGIVHRLDKETSGCIVVAKTDEAHRSLSDQFKARTVEKIYMAIVSGLMTQQAGDVRAAIARHPSHRKCMTVTEGGGREAWTSYRVVESLRESTWVEVRLHTGRTHQIRVHFKHIGHPLVGDVVYGKRQVARLKEMTGYEPGRFLLHSYQLRFVHPRTGKAVGFQAPLPLDFREALKALTLRGSSGRRKSQR